MTAATVKPKAKTAAKPTRTAKRLDVLRKIQPLDDAAEAVAPLLAQQRMPAMQDNPLAAMEASRSKLLSQSLDNHRSARDGASERLFSLLYRKN